MAVTYNALLKFAYTYVLFIYLMTLILADRISALPSNASIVVYIAYSLQWVANWFLSLIQQRPSNDGHRSQDLVRSLQR